MVDAVKGKQCESQFEWFPSSQPMNLYIITCSFKHEDDFCDGVKTLYGVARSGFQLNAKVSLQHQ